MEFLSFSNGGSGTLSLSKSFSDAEIGNTRVMLLVVVTTFEVVDIVFFEKQEKYVPFSLEWRIGNSNCEENEKRRESESKYV